ncbi:hypothetical protein AB2L57_01750 [Microbacterium sp. HA-8]|uniref:hypothetical protein n=1 Tax=unclassified Microbacterium TaxID=2609290 RepID=UPI000C2C9435|nr:hypothetical protein [Microbacterium sp. BR1]
MTRAALFQAILPGEWAEGWLYKDHLFLWTTDGDLVHTPVARLVSQLHGTHGPEVALAAQFALFRNDWKGGMQIEALTRVPRIRDALSDTVSAASKVARVEFADPPMESVDIESVPGFLLSVSIYGNHAFIASSDGLFETNLNPEYLGQEHYLESRLSFAVHDLDTNYGAVAASAFEEGLWFDRIDFGHEEGRSQGNSMQRLADFSSGVSMASKDLLNFVEEGIPNLYLGASERRLQSPRSRFPSHMITGYRRSDDDLAMLSARSLGIDESRVREGGVRVLANSKQRLLYDVDGDLRVARLRTLDGVKLDRAAALGVRLDDATAGGAPVSTHAMAGGFLVEGQERVSWIDHDGVLEVSSQPAVTVRTFPGSRHFIDTALIIEEDRAILVGFLDIPRS